MSKQKHHFTFLFFVVTHLDLYSNHFANLNDRLVIASAKQHKNNTLKDRRISYRAVRRL